MAQNTFDFSYFWGKLSAILAGKVDKVAGKGLSTEDFTTAEKTKLSGIEAGAEVNVQANWTQTSSSADDFIKNKPTLGAAAAKGVDSAPTASSTNLVESGGVYDALAAKISMEDILGVGTTITSNSSMDSLTSIGKWYCVNAPTAVTVTNAPFTDAAYFGWTIRSIASSDRYIQIAIKNTDDLVIAKRRYSGVWSAWSYITGTAATSMQNGG